MRKRLSNWALRERPAPVRLGVERGNRDRSAVVVQHREGHTGRTRDRAADEFREVLAESCKVELCAEDEVGFARRAIPDPENELILEEAGEDSLLGVADEIGEMDASGQDFGRGGLGLDRWARRFEGREVDATLGGDSVDFDTALLAKKRLVAEKEKPGLGAF